MRSVLATLALISAAAPAVAAELWPQPDSGWQFSLVVPAGPGRERYGQVDADPAPPGGWTITVTCGLQDSRTGRALSRVVGMGTSNRGLAPGFGGSGRGLAVAEARSSSRKACATPRASTCPANSPPWSAPVEARATCQLGTEQSQGTSLGNEACSSACATTATMLQPWALIATVATVAT